MKNAEIFSNKYWMLELLVEKPIRFLVTFGSTHPSASAPATKEFSKRHYYIRFLDILSKPVGCFRYLVPTK